MAATTHRGAAGPTGPCGPAFTSGPLRGHSPTSPAALGPVHYVITSPFWASSVCLLGDKERDGWRAPLELRGQLVPPQPCSHPLHYGRPQAARPGLKFFHGGAGVRGGSLGVFGCTDALENTYSLPVCGLLKFQRESLLFTTQFRVPRAQWTEGCWVGRPGRRGVMARGSPGQAVGRPDKWPLSFAASPPFPG